MEHNNHTIYSEWKLTSDYTPLIVNISIFKEHIQTRKHMLVKNSEEEDNFIDNLIEAIKGLNIKNIQSKEVLDQIVQLFASVTERIWYKHSKVINITKHSKEWWSKYYCRDPETYWQTRQIKDWRQFKGTIKKTKHDFFNLKIQEVANKNCKPWELMNWIKKCKIPAI